MPRTENLKKSRVRYCGDCGYELAPDHAGTCPMCARFQQLRIDFTVPRPSDLAAHHVETLGTRPVAPQGGPPTIAEYRSILAERRLASGSTPQSAATVIRTPELTRPIIPSPLRGAPAPGDDALAEPIAPAKDLASPSPKKPRTSKKTSPRRGQGESRPVAAGRDRSARRAKKTDSPAAASSWIPRESAHVPATPRPSAPPKGLKPPSVRAEATGDQTLATSQRAARALMQAVPAPRPVSRSSMGVTWPSIITVAIVVLSGLIGAVVPILLSFV